MKFEVRRATEISSPTFGTFSKRRLVAVREAVSNLFQDTGIGLYEKTIFERGIWAIEVAIRVRRKASGSWTLVEDIATVIGRVSLPEKMRMENRFAR